jgi:hypothetical protein
MQMQNKLECLSQICFSVCLPFESMGPQFFFLTYELAQSAKVFARGKCFHSSLMFVSKAEAYQSDAPFRSFTLG